MDPASSRRAPHRGLSWLLSSGKWVRSRSLPPSPQIFGSQPRSKAEERWPDTHCTDGCSCLTLRNWRLRGTIFSPGTSWVLTLLNSLSRDEGRSPLKLPDGWPCQPQPFDLWTRPWRLRPTPQELSVTLFSAHHLPSPLVTK